MAIAYIATLIGSWVFFPLLWHRTFAEGIQWDLAAARRNAFKLIPLGLVMGFTVQAISSLIPVPKSIPMDNFFRTPSDVWLVTAFGTLLAPLFEEICFRGFLLPAFAIAYDWLSPPRTPMAHERWQTTTNLTRPALLFSGILTSIFFALIHAEQLAHAWAALFVLFCVSLVLTFVRIRTQVRRLLGDRPRLLQPLRLPLALHRHRRLPPPRTHDPIAAAFLLWLIAGDKPTYRYEFVSDC